MKKLLGIRILVAVLCLVMTLAVFVACGPAGSGGDETTTEGAETKNTETITASNCVIITSGTAEDSVNAAALVLVKGFKEHLGVDVQFRTDAESVSADAFEILVGSTNREESKDVLSALNGQNGYVVKKVGNKIAIDATSVSMLDDAATYLVNNYLVGASNGTFEVANDLCYAYGSTGGIAILDADNNSQYTLIYSQNIDTESNTRTDDNGNIIDVYNKGLDYIYPYILECWEGINEEIGTILPVDTDFGTAKDSNLEILIGNTNRPETKTFLKSLAPNEYGYGVVGNKLVIAGWGDFTTSRAIARFLNDIDNYLVAGDGVNNLVMSDGEKAVYSYDEWSLDVPLFKGGDMEAIVDLLDNGLEMYYLNASADSFKEYVQELKDAGLDCWQENEIAGNLFATYYSSKTMVHAYYMPYNNTVRVITESMTTAVLPQNEDPNMGAKITDTTFTMVDLDEGVKNFGNCFIITLEDGSFILHDGGGDASKGKGGTIERDELFNVLKKLNKRKDGEIVIAAWVISHQHWDHFKNSYDMFKQYYKRLTLERVIYSEPGETTIYNSYNPGGYMSGGHFEQIATWTGAEMIKFHTGQTIQIRNLKITAYLGAEDMYPDSVEKFNNTSLVTRFTIGEGANAQTMMIVGDTEEVGSKRLVQMYGDALKCDFMQVAHHGYGGSIELYAKCAPKVVLWPKDQKAVDGQLSGTGYYPGINQSLVNQKNVVLLVVADNGHKTIPLPLLGLTSDRNKNQKLVESWDRLDGR